MSPVVSLDVLPADVPAEYAPMMVAACSDALAEGSCAMAATLPESTRPEAVALVLWQGDDFLQVTVRVGRGGAQWVARSLAFSEGDSISERWTTVGLTIATLVGETRSLSAAPSAAIEPAVTPPPVATLSPPTSPAPRETPRRAARSAPSAAWAVSTGLLSGPGWDGGGWQRGGWLAFGVRLSGLPIQAHVFGSYAQSDGPTVRQVELSTSWLTVGGGAGIFGTFRPLSLLGSAELELAYRRVEGNFAGHNVGTQELPVRLRASLSVPADGIVAATLGAVLRIPPQNGDRSDGAVVRSAPVDVEGLLGLEVRL